MGVTPDSGYSISFTQLYSALNNDNPTANSNISASVLMNESWPKGPSPGDGTYPYICWGVSGSYNYANRIANAPHLASMQAFYGINGTCQDDCSWPAYRVEYSIDVLFGDSNDNITDMTFAIKDSSLTNTLVSDYQAILQGPTNITDNFCLSTQYTPNVQNCYWTLDFTCEYRNKGQGSMRGFCDTNDGNGYVQVFVVNPIYDATTYNLSYNTNGYAPTASANNLPTSYGGGFKWKFEFN
jgi:hypothetical protein